MLALALTALIAFQQEDVVRTAAEYYAMWNGDFPPRFDDLVTKGTAKVWPDGGFLERVPTLDYSDGKVAGVALVLRKESAAGIDVKILTTRYRLALLKSEILAHLRKTKALPATLKDLASPKTDSWGNAIEWTTGAGVGKLSSPGFALPAVEKMTDEVRKRCAELVGLLGSESFDERNKASEELDKMGAPIEPILEESLKTAEDKEVNARLTAILGKLKAERMARQGSSTELAIHVFDPPAMKMNDRNGINALKSMATAQSDFRSNDRDNNLINDFWTGDVYALSALVGMNPNGDPPPALNWNVANKLIEMGVAKADGAPRSNPKFLAEPAPAFPAPYKGYLVRAVRQYDESGTLRDFQVDTDGKKRFQTNLDRFAFVAYPAAYGVTGKKTYFINQDNTIFWKDTGGDPFVIDRAVMRDDGWKSGE